VLFTLGLMSKPMLVTLPFVLLLLDYWPLRRWQPRSETAPALEGLRQVALSRLVLEKVPLFFMTTACSAITFFAQKSSGAVRELTGPAALVARSENALVAYCRYLAKMFYPVKLAAFYPFRNAWPRADVVLAVCLLVGVSTLVIALRRNR